MQPSFPPRIKLFLLSLIGLFTLAPTSHAQLDQADKNLYWVYLNDKGDDSQQRISNRTVSLSPRALENRRIHSISLDQADLPVSTKYLQQLSQLDGLSIRQTSRWLNAVSVEIADPALLAEISSLDFVRSIEILMRWRVENEEIELPPASASYYRSSNEIEDPSKINYGFADDQTRQIAINELHQRGYFGEDILIGIMDGGFRGVDTAAPFASIWEENRMLDYWNFHLDNDSVFRDSQHGTAVLSTMAAEIPGLYLGVAPKATYCLYLTEVVEFERLIEEDHWVAAAERADSLGVDVLNTSLGYTTFDSEDAPFNHSYGDMDGNTTVITRAADWAASRGMIVVVSAGNQGDDDWFYISAPSDGDSVMAVGAVDVDGGIADFSGHGPSFDGDVKPNVVARGSRTWIVNAFGEIGQSSGTSFSAPIIAASMACLKSAFPEIDPMVLFHTVERTGSHFNQPNADFGFGLPNFGLAYHLLRGPDLLSSDGNLQIFPNPVTAEAVVVVGALPASEGSLEVFDVSGRRMFGQQIAVSDAQANLFQFNAGDWDAGIYLIEVKLGEYQRSLKFLKN